MMEVGDEIRGLPNAYITMAYKEIILCLHMPPFLVYRVIY